VASVDKEKGSGLFSAAAENVTANGGLLQGRTKGSSLTILNEKKE